MASTTINTSSADGAAVATTDAASSPTALATSTDDVAAEAVAADAESSAVLATHAAEDADAASTVSAGGGDDSDVRDGAPAAAAEGTEEAESGNAENLGATAEAEPSAAQEGAKEEAADEEPMDAAVAQSPAEQLSVDAHSEKSAAAASEEKEAAQSAESEAASESAAEAAAAPAGVAGKRKEVDAADGAQSNGASASTPKKQKTEENGAVKAEVSSTTATTTTTTTTAAATATASKEAAPMPPPVNALAAPIMLSRDDMAKMEEDGGLVKFDVITNDGAPEHLVQLTTLKNIFARQLPKMPKEYIVRLVFDRNHRSMVILKNGTHVIGGICYRPFLPNHFAEIAFCAINAADQVKGYGTRLMNHLKEFVKQEGITHFLTYADNYAIGYFKKQGFAKVVSMPRPNWFGYIKDYDGGTLMECTIHYQIDYLRITSMVHKQRKAIQDKIKERSRAHIVYPGLEKFAEGRLMDIYMIPGVKEAGWSQATIRNSRIGTRDPGSLKTQLTQLWKAVSSHRSAWPFHEPVDTTIVVDYLEFIKDPVDLSLIAKRIESGQYTSKAALRADLDVMCTNCTVYNTPDTNYYKAAKDLQEFIERRVQIRDGPPSKP